MPHLLLIDGLRTLAIHNQRINDRLLNLSIELSEVDLLADRGAFFGSIFNHWNHLMFGDLMLLRRIRDGSPGSDVLDELATFPTPKTPRDVYYHDMVTLAHNRRRLDSLLVKWAMSVPVPHLGRNYVTLPRKVILSSLHAASWLCIYSCINCIIGVS